MRLLLGGVFFLLALLGANSAYLLGVRILGSLGLDLLNWFVPWMLLGHVALGLLVAGPFGLFALLHGATAWRRGNRTAALAGAALVAIVTGLFATGALLCRIEGFTERFEPLNRSLIYWLHVGLPVAALAMYGLHRGAGRPIRWRLGRNYLLATSVCVALLCVGHSLDPRRWSAVAPEEGAEYFAPSLARTVGGTFIPAERLMTDAQCAECHPEIAASHAHGAHKRSSFNNPFYLAAVRRTRAAMLDRDGSVKAARWCAGCHDPVPLASGAFDDPFFQDVTDPTAHAGVTCSVCHGITAVGIHGGNRGNGDYLLEAAEPYPFEDSSSPALRWLNRQLVLAMPSLHKRSMLKPLHKTSEFCATCHKVSLPTELNDYHWLRGQNHYDSFRLSGVAGGGATAFYYPQTAHQNCNACHMPRTPATDFAATADGSGELTVHNHLFPGANTALAWWDESAEAFQASESLLKNCLRIDLFGLRRGGRIDDPLTSPLRPSVPVLKPGETVLLETVVRTLTLGHAFTEGTADSNQAWVEVTVRSGDRLLFSSGANEAMDSLDPAAH
ncbi:MAG: multiheme c-type cytochrome, partial [Planctomycetota bacterium]